MSPKKVAGELEAKYNWNIITELEKTNFLTYQHLTQKTILVIVEKNMNS